MGHLVEAMAEAGIDTSSITMIALTHAHGDHINGLLMPDGRRAFNGLRKIVIGEDAVEEFLAEPVLEQFRSLLAPINGGDRLADHLLAVDIPGHARGHMGYLLNTDEDDVFSAATLSTFLLHSLLVPSLPGPMTMTNPWRGLTGSGCSRT